MRITDVETIVLRAKLKTPSKSAMGSTDAMTQVLIKVETSEGIEGYGETWTNFPSWAYVERQATIQDGIKPLLIGRDVEDHVSLIHDIFRRLTRPMSQWGARAMLYQALSGVDQALWDIRGKSAKLPVCSLLGGVPKSIPVYASGLGPDSVVSDAEKLLERGFRAFKLRMGMDLETDLQNVIHLRRVIGDECDLMIDANQNWSLSEVWKVLEVLEEQAVYWIEEPVPSLDFEALQKIKAKTNIRIACGENYYGTDFTAALKAGVIDIVQPDVTKCGGITEMNSISQMSRYLSRDWAPHFFGGAVGMAASLQILGWVPNSLIMEYPYDDMPLRTDILATKFDVVNGKVRMPDLPGLGIELDQEALNFYRIN